MTRLQSLCERAAVILDRAEVEAVLVGGAAAHWLAPAIEADGDADFVVPFPEDVARARAALLAAGMIAQGPGIRFPDAPDFVDLSAGPLMIGDEEITAVDRIACAGGTLRVLTPNDVVKDRLLWHCTYGDADAFHAALAVAAARSTSVDLDQLATWVSRDSSFAGNTTADLAARRRFDRFISEARRAQTIIDR